MSFDVRRRQNAVSSILPFPKCHFIHCNGICTKLSPAYTFESQILDRRNARGEFRDFFITRMGFCISTIQKQQYQNTPQCGIYYVKPGWILIRGYDSSVVVNTVTYGTQTLECKSVHVLFETIYCLTSDHILFAYDPETKQRDQIAYTAQSVHVRNNELFIKCSEFKYRMSEMHGFRESEFVKRELCSKHTYDNNCYYVHNYKLEANDFEFQFCGKVLCTYQMGHCIFITTAMEDYVWDLKYLQVFEVDYLDLQYIGNQTIYEFLSCTWYR